MFCLTAMCVVTHCCGVGVVISCSLPDTLYSVQYQMHIDDYAKSIEDNKCFVLVECWQLFEAYSFLLCLPLYGGTSDFLGFGIGVIQQNTSLPCTNLST